MSITQAILASYPAGSTTPTLPAWVASSTWWSCSNNFNPVGYPAGTAMDAHGFDANFTGVSPYPVDYAGYIGSSDPPPYPIFTLDDQNSNANNLDGTFSSPIWQITTSVVVTGGSQPGVYLFGGLTDDGAGGFAPYYNLIGRPNSIVNYAIVLDLNALGGWFISNGIGSQIYTSDGNNIVFPWLDTWTGITVNPASPQTGRIEFDGTSTGFQSAANLFVGGRTNGTIYLDYQPLDLVSTGVIFETGVGSAAGLAQNISIRQVGAVLTFSVYDNTAVVALANTKIVTLGSTDRIVVACTFDTTQGTAANQTAMKVNDSATGVTSPISTNLSSLTIGDAKVSVGARNNASSAFLTANMWNCGIIPRVDNAAQQTAMVNYINSLDH